MPYKRYFHKRNKRALNIRKTIAEKKLLSAKSVNCDVTEGEEPTTSEELFDRLLRTNLDKKSPEHRHEGKENDLEQMDFSDDGDEDFELPDLLIEPCNDTQDLNITGRRVVNINHVLAQLQKISSHHRQCTMGKYKFNREVVSGLFSKFIFYCDNCESEVAVTSEPEDRRQEVNDAVVWGALSNGIGHSQIQELFGVMDVPVMGPKKFKLHEKRVGKVTQFYIECLLPEILDSRITRGLKARDPPYILEAQERKEKKVRQKKEGKKNKEKEH